MNSQAQPFRSILSPADLCILCVLLIVWIQYAISFSLDTMADDGYITLRFSYNLLMGKGFVYNPGEYVLGTTAPLFAMLLAASGAIMGEPYTLSLPQAALFWSSFFSLSSAVSLLILLRISGVPATTRCLTLLILSISPALLSANVSGMETSAVLCFMLLSLLLSLQSHFVLAALSCSVLILLRVDTLIWCGPLFIWLCLKERRILVKELCLGLIPVVLWSIFAFYYFGSPIPHTITAKAAAQSDSISYSGYLLRYLSVFHMQFSPENPIRLLISIAIAVFSVTGFISLWSQSHNLRPLLLWFLIYVTLFFLQKAPFFDWYYTIPRLVLYLLIAHGLWNLVLHYIEKLLQYSFFLPGLTILITAWIQPGLLFERYHPTQQVCISKWLGEHTSRGKTLYLEHIGYIGFHSPDSYIYDNKALVSPRMLSYVVSNSPDQYIDAVLSLKPDVAILWDHEIPAAKMAVLEQSYTAQTSCTDSSEETMYIYTLNQ